MIPAVLRPARRSLPARRRVLVVGISGPDGAGKSTLVTELERRLAASGRPPRRVYLYGCVICRRVASPGASALPGARVPVHRTFPKFLLTLHGFIDATELAIRLGAAVTAAGLMRCGNHKRVADNVRVVLTERTPLDGLVKHDPRRGSCLAALYLRLASQYDLIIGLGAAPSVLEARDTDHDSASLSVLANRYEHVRTLLPNVVSLRTDHKSTLDIADAAEQAIRARATPPTGNQLTTHD